jgi:hypothetical protein
MQQSPNPNWQYGDGANSDEWKQHKKLQINPNGPGRMAIDNYKLLVSAVVPRPVCEKHSRS